MLEHLDAAGVPYLLTGSFAASAHGFLRTTHDFDFVIDPDSDTLQSFLDRLSPDDYDVDAGAAKDALARRTMFNVIDQATQWKFDLIVSPRDDFALNQFDRRGRVVIAGNEVWVASAEDVVVSKLVWARQGSSERQLRDVGGVVAVQGEALDRAYVETWAKRLGVDDLWRTVLAGLPPVGGRPTSPAPSTTRPTPSRPRRTSGRRRGRRAARPRDGGTSSSPAT